MCLASFASGLDKQNSALWLATQVDKMGLSCPLCPVRKMVFFMPYYKSQYPAISTEQAWSTTHIKCPQFLGRAWLPNIPFNVISENFCGTLGWPPLDDDYLYSYHLFSWQFTDIIRRYKKLITLGNVRIAFWLISFDLQMMSLWTTVVYTKKKKHISYHIIFPS